MVVLGCQLYDWGPSIMLRDRLDKALDYLADHPETTVVVSGGQGAEEPTSEAQGMADYLADHGFPRENYPSAWSWAGFSGQTGRTSPGPGAPGRTFSAGWAYGLEGFK